MRTHGITAGLLCAWLALAGHVAAGGKGAQKPAHKTPEAAFASIQKATAKGDWKAFAAHLAPETVDHLTAFLVVMGAVSHDLLDPPPGMPVAMLKELKGELDKVLVKYGVTTETLKKMNADKVFPNLKRPPMADDLDKIAIAVKKDRRTGFVGAGMGVIAPVLGKAGPNKTPDLFANKVLRDVKVEGNMATGTLMRIVNGQEQGSQPIMFHQIEGSWYVVMPIGGKKAGSPKPVEKQ